MWILISWLHSDPADLVLQYSKDIYFLKSYGHSVLIRSTTLHLKMVQCILNMYAESEISNEPVHMHILKAAYSVTMNIF